MSRLLLWLVLFHSSLACADVYECAGTWTDRPCEGLKQAVSDNDHTADGAEAEKKRIVAALSRFAQKVQAETGRADFEADSTRDFCAKAEVSVEECRIRALRADKSLLSSLQTFSRIRQRSIELAQHAQELVLRRERQLRDFSKPKAPHRQRS